MSELTLCQLRELAKKHGKEYGREFIIWAQQNGILKNPTDIEREVHKNTIKNSGCKSRKEYVDMCKQKLGYEDYKEYKRMYKWNKGINSPMSENENCASYVGNHIGEKIGNVILDIIFEDVKMMPYGNKGYDVICKNPRKEFIDKYTIHKFSRDVEYKFDIKTERLYGRSDGNKTYYMWTFGIRYNNVPDYFLLIGIDDENGQHITVHHIWLFRKDEIVRHRKFNQFSGFCIGTDQYRISKLNIYELKDVLKIFNGIYDINKDEEIY